MGLPMKLDKTDSLIFGVCGGVAKSLGIKTSIVRLSVFVSFLIWGMWPIFVGYVVAAIVMPKESRYGY